MIQLNESKQFPYSRFFSFLPGSAKRNRHSARRPRNITFSLITCCEYESATGGGCGLGDEQTSPLSCKLRKKGKKRGDRAWRERGVRAGADLPRYRGQGWRWAFPDGGLAGSWNFLDLVGGASWPRQAGGAGRGGGRPAWPGCTATSHASTHAQIRILHYTDTTRIVYMPVVSSLWISGGEWGSTAVMMDRPACLSWLLLGIIGPLPLSWPPAEWPVGTGESKLAGQGPWVIELFWRGYLGVRQAAGGPAHHQCGGICQFSFKKYLS